MKSYTLEEAGKLLPTLFAEAAEHPVPIVREDQTTVYLINPDSLDGLLETYEILNDPEAMKAIDEPKAGKGIFYSLEEVDAILGPLEDDRADEG